MASGLLSHGSVVTTSAKAKELVKFVEPLITEAKGELTLHRNRRLRSALHNADTVQALVKTAKAMKDRPGGYTRRTRLPAKRGDGAEIVKIELTEKS